MHNVAKSWSVQFDCFITKPLLKYFLKEFTKNLSSNFDITEVEQNKGEDTIVTSIRPTSSLTHDELILLSRENSTAEDYAAAKALEGVPDFIKKDLAMSNEVKDMRSLCAIINLANMYHIETLFERTTSPEEFDELANLVLPELLNETSRHTSSAGIEAYRRRGNHLENLRQAGTAKFFYRQEDNTGDLWFPYNGLLGRDFGTDAVLVGGRLSSVNTKAKKITVQEVCIYVLYLYFLMQFLIPHSFHNKGI